MGVSNDFAIVCPHDKKRIQNQGRLTVGLIYSTDHRMKEEIKDEGLKKGRGAERWTRNMFERTEGDVACCKNNQSREKTDRSYTEQLH